MVCLVSSQSHPYLQVDGGFTAKIKKKIGPSSESMVYLHLALGPSGGVRMLVSSLEYFRLVFLGPTGAVLRHMTPTSSLSCELRSSSISFG